MSHRLSRTIIVMLTGTAVLIVIGGLLAWFDAGRNHGADRSSIEPLREGGRMAENGIYSNATPDEIVVATPRTDTKITSPITITGRARGSWFFEATAPVLLVDWDGRIIAESSITAQDDWMTEAFVPFEGTLIFDTPDYGERGAIILRAANPSGLPQDDRAIEIPIRFRGTR